MAEAKMKILYFFINPGFETSTSLRTKIFNLLDAVKFSLVGYVVLMIVFVLVHSAAAYFNSNFSLYHTVSKLNLNLGSQTPITIFLYGVILIPLIEEIAFRGFFNLKKIFICISISALTYIFINVITSFDKRVAIVISFAVFLFSYAFVKENLVSYIKNNFRIFFFLSNLIFVGFHVFNYKLSEFEMVDYFALPIVLVPQLIATINFSFLRIRNGLLWSYLFHSMENMIFLFPYILKGLK